MGKKTSKSKDIYSGSEVVIWEDGKLIFITFTSNSCTLSFTKEEWKVIKSEIEECIDLP